MAKHKDETTEYIPSWDDGTYHTGSARPHKEHRGLIAVLMILVTFLGGLASALGLINIHLLQELADATAGPDNVGMYVDSENTIPKMDDPATDTAPSAPSPEDWDLPLEAPQQETVPTQEILLRNDPAIVTVHRDEPESEAVACGVIMDEEGFLITNAYPISDCSHIYVQLSDGRYFRASVVGTDEFTDLAVLYINAQDLIAAPFADTQTLLVGEEIVFIGTDRVAQEGHVLDHDADYAVGNDIFDLLETNLHDIAGPIFNACGQMVGFSSPALGEDGCTMAIPSDLVKDVARQIIRNGVIHGRPCLGAEVEEVQKLYQQYWQLPQGLRVTRTFRENSHLEGLAPGDILISLDGQPITDRESLYAVLRDLRAGDQVTVTVVRDNETITLTLTIQTSGSQGE